MPSHPHLAGETRILEPHWKFSPACTHIMLKAHTFTRILFDANKISQTNRFAERTDKISHKSIQMRSN